MGHSQSFFEPPFDSILALPFLDIITNDVCLLIEILLAS